MPSNTKRDAQYAMEDGDFKKACEIYQQRLVEYEQLEDFMIKEHGLRMVESVKGRLVT